MTVKIFLASLLLLEIFTAVKCAIDRKVNEEKQNCTFILSNGDYEEFLHAIPLFKNCTRQFEKPSLVIKLSNYMLPAFPNGTFTDLPRLHEFKLDIADGSQIQLLSPMLPSYFVFEGMEFDRATFDIDGIASIIGWKWETLFNLSNAHTENFEFIVMRTKLIYLPSDFGKIAHGRLTAIRIHSCQLRWLSKNVFERHSNLLVLELRNNLIEKFERFHLPQNPAKLRSIDLEYNRLQYISMDVFLDLKLKDLFLKGNNIKILSSQIESFTGPGIPQIYGVTWPCDCRNISKLLMKWKDYFSYEDCFINGKVKEIREFIRRCD